MKTIKDRRQFLKYSGLGMALLASPLLWRTGAYAGAATLPAKADKEFLALCDTPVMVSDRNNYGIAVTNPGSIKILEVATGTTSAIDTPFFGHSIVQNPARPHQLATFEKWGKRMGAADMLDPGKFVSIEAPDDRIFYGHGIYLADGSAVVATEATIDSHAGLISHRDPATLKIIRTMETFGTRPHQCQAINGGKTFIVANEGLFAQGDKANVAWIDLESGKLLQKVEFDLADETQHGHLDISYDDWICVLGCAEKKSKKDVFNLIYFVSPDGKIFKPKLPDDMLALMKGEALSVAFLGHTGLVAVTMKQSDMVFVFNYKSQELINAVPIAMPRGVLQNAAAGNEHDILVSSAKDLDLVSVAGTDEDIPVTAIASTAFGGRGSHLTRFYL